VPHRSRLAAASLLETVAAHRSLLAATSLLATPHHSLLAATSLLDASLLPRESTWVARLLAATRDGYRAWLGLARLDNELAWLSSLS
jgi:hypothetical protein